ncbi:hypothetical protein Fmac_028685 [Flemingia macrophylla]|uniref:Uncharacterized protein n=1 Tax=Flemingia macrophylla TaxID=520843 RepID=A0ABD1L8A2_9FABA
MEGKLDALVNLVTQLAANQKPASVARVYGICSSNVHHTKVCSSSQQSGVDEYPEPRVVILRLILQAPIADQHSSEDKALDREDGSECRGVHDVPTNTSAKTRKLEGKLDALLNLVTQIAAN